MERLLPLLSTTFICFSLLLALKISPAKALSFNYDRFDPGLDNCVQGSKAVCLQGDAFVVHDERAISLTKNQIDKILFSSVGRATYSEPLHLWTNSKKTTVPNNSFNSNSSFSNNNSVVAASFSAEFTFAINKLGNPNQSADGITFFLGHYPSEIPVNSSGRCLGLLTDSINTSNIPNVTNPNETFVAVEFDSFKNFFDFSSRHVGIDINSILSVQYFNISRYFEGNITGAARVDYDGVAGNLSVQLEYDRVKYSMARSVRLWEILPEWVSVGFSGTTGQQVEVHEILSWKFNSTTLPGDDDDKNGTSAGLVVGVTVAVVVSVMLGAGSLLLFLLRRKKRRAAQIREIENVEQELWTSSCEDDDPTLDQEIRMDKPGPRRFLYKELFMATAGYADNRKLGGGGFGNVYHGFLEGQSDCAEVAIKKVSEDSSQGKKEYLSEIRIISRLRHRNLVQLLGWCHARGELLLVYEYMANGSLDNHLHDARNDGCGVGESPVMPWPTRYKVAMGLTSAMLYLHEEGHQCVLHRDIKPSNVLLDSFFEAKLGDFGLARLVNHGGGMYTTALAGTPGYMAPECFFTSYKPSKESDVYSLGVVLLEIGSGRRPYDCETDTEQGGGEVDDGLVSRVWKLYGKEAILEAADKRLDKLFDTEQMERLLLVGLWCAHPDPKQRPNMKQVVGALNFEAPPPDLPLRMPVIICSYMTSANTDLHPTYGLSPGSVDHH